MLFTDFSTDWQFQEGRMPIRCRYGLYRATHFWGKLGERILSFIEVFVTIL